MTRPFKTVSVSREDSLKYLAKALEYLEAANGCRSDGRFSSAGLLAIQAAIASADAILGWAAGYRSSSPDHGDVVELFRQQLRHSEGSDKQANRLSRIIGKKNLVQYEAREITQKEASYLVEQAERFVNWVKEIIGR